MHGVYDRMTGAPLRWELVEGEQARREGLPNAPLEGRYIMVHLARAVPKDGEARVRIDKTYMDTASYFARGDTIVFTRSLGIKRNSVVLPLGYELIGVNHPSQIVQEADGRIRVSFMNLGTAAVPYTVRGRKLPRVPVADVAGEVDATAFTRGHTRRGAASFRAGLPGSRDCVFPEPARDALIPVVSRLHGNP